MRRSIAIFALIVLAIPFYWLVSGCARQPTSAAVGTVRLKLTDAPGDFDSVCIVVSRVSAHIAGSDDGAGGWEQLTDTPATYDLLTLRNGVFATMAIAQVPAGTYTQLRLQIGDGSHVVVDGVAHPLEIPSGVQTGAKLVGEFEVPAGGLLDLELDFDAARSIVLTGSGTWRLDPVIRVRPYGASGALHGSVVPSGTAVDVFAITGGETAGVTAADAGGGFQASVLAPGTYALRLRPGPAFRETTLTDIHVAAGAVTEIGTIELTPAE